MGSGESPRKLDRFGALGWADRWLFLRAVGWLLLARTWLVLVPFPRLAERLSAGRGAAEPDLEVLSRVSFAVHAAAANVPWRSDCFPKAIAASKLLASFGYRSSIHLGVKKSGPRDILGHAWLACGGTVVTGGEDLDQYVEIHRLGE